MHYLAASSGPYVVKLENRVGVGSLFDYNNYTNEPQLPNRPVLCSDPV